MSTTRLESRFRRDLLSPEQPLNPSSSTHWRQHLGDTSIELLSGATIDAAVKSKAVWTRDRKCAAVGTTVQEKAIAFPINKTMYNRSHERLARIAKTYSVRLRQSYLKIESRPLLENNHYDIALQTRRIRRTTSKIMIVLGRVVMTLSANRSIRPNRDVASITDLVWLSKLIRARQPHDKYRCYILPGSAVE